MAQDGSGEGENFHTGGERETVDGRRSEKQGKRQSAKVKMQKSNRDCCDVEHLFAGHVGAGFALPKRHPRVVPLPMDSCLWRGSGQLVRNCESLR
jgi:hypothetical protein